MRRKFVENLRLRQKGTYFHAKWARQSPPNSILKLAFLFLFYNNQKTKGMSPFSCSARRFSATLHFQARCQRLTSLEHGIASSHTCMHSGQGGGLSFLHACMVSVSSGAAALVFGLLANSRRETGRKRAQCGAINVLTLSRRRARSSSSCSSSCRR